MNLRTIILLIGIGLLLGPAIPSLVQGFVLFYEFNYHQITVQEYQQRIMPIITDLLTPTEASIVWTFGKYGMWVVAIVLFAYWYFTGRIRI